MFDRFFDLLLQCLDYLKFMAILQPYEAGVLVRLGKFVRVLEPGWHLIVPVIDIIHREHTVPRTHSLHTQSVMTIDGKQITFQAVITSQVRDIKKALLDVEDGEHAIQDSCSGCIAYELSHMSWNDILVASDTTDKVTAACRKRGFKYGLEITAVQFSTMSLSKALRLFQS